MTTPPLCDINDGIYIGSQYMIYKMISLFKAALTATSEMTSFISQLSGQHPYYVHIPGTELAIKITESDGGSGYQFIDALDLEPDKYYKYEIYSLVPQIGTLVEETYYKRNQATFLTSLVQPHDIWVDIPGLATVDDSDPDNPVYTDGIPYGIVSSSANIAFGLMLIRLIVKILKKLHLIATLRKFMSYVYGKRYKDYVKDSLETLLLDVTDLDSDIVNLDGDVANIDTDLSGVSVDIAAIKTAIIELAAKIGLRLTL